MTQASHLMLPVLISLSIFEFLKKKKASKSQVTSEKDTLSLKSYRQYKMKLMYLFAVISSNTASEWPTKKSSVEFVGL